jgi:DNA-binding transcriptional regulator YiaG
MRPPAPDEIKAARTRLGLSQAAFAARIGCSIAAVAMWELGTRRPKGLYLRELRRVMDEALMAPPPRTATASPCNR